MNWTKIKHYGLITAGLLSAFAGVVYQGSLANNKVGPGMTFGVLAGLVFAMWSRLQVIWGKPDAVQVATIYRVFHVAAAIAGVVMPVLVMFSSRFTASSQAFIISGYVTTFLGDLAKAGQALPMVGQAETASSTAAKAPAVVGRVPGGTLFVLLVLSTLLMSQPVTAAEPTPSSVSPTLSFCFGKTFHCVIPDCNVAAVSYDVSAKKWVGEAESLGAGWALLFYSDQPWSSGIALHGSAQFKEGGPKYLNLVPTLVIARYFEAGVKIQLADGSIGRWLTFGLGGQIDVLSGRSMADRYKDAVLATKAN